MCGGKWKNRPKTQLWPCLRPEQLYEPGLIAIMWMMYMKIKIDFIAITCLEMSRNVETWLGRRSEKHKIVRKQTIKLVICSQNE